MSEKDTFEPGTSKLEDFWYWINERHSIYLKKEAGEPKPWTDDKILQTTKFTNPFRQLDRGTKELRSMILRAESEFPNIRVYPDLYVFNVMWYRLFNLAIHAAYPGFRYDGAGKNTLFDILRQKALNGQKVFTSAHMTTGVAGEPKVETYIRACEEAWEKRHKIAELCRKSGYMETVFYELIEGYMIGRFVGYEIVCDFRFIPELWSNRVPGDTLTWANMGPGAARGLARLGLLQNRRSQVEGLEAMRALLFMAAEQNLSVEVKNAPVPFELREIEHSLCEFDKYERVKRGEGQAKMKYNGRY